MSPAQPSLLNLPPELAFRPYFPTADQPWDETRVAHLYRRAAFGASWKQIQAGVRKSPDELTTEILRGNAAAEAAFEAELARLEEGVLLSGEPRQLKGLWLYRMATSPSPLQERMTLFWHDHFATSNAKVGQLKLMHQQVETLRRHALGHFGEMLQEMTRDPAMLVWLDSATNRKGQPNENYARELFELFSLGVGNYTEKDIQEAARALTGWNVRNGEAEFNPAMFDAGEKTILGQTGPWGAGDVVRIVLRQPACGRFLVRKLFAEFVSETVELPDAFLNPLAEEFRIRDYDLRWLVGALLRSWIFFSPATLGQRVKGPIEFLIGTLRTLDGAASPLQLADLCDQLGQSPYYPPSVKGWDGGVNWLNSTTLLFRQNIAFEWTRGAGLGAGTDPARLVETLLSDAATSASVNVTAGEQGIEETIARSFLRLLLQNPEHEALPQIVDQLRVERAALVRQGRSARAIRGFLARTAAHLVMTLPDYQLS